MNHIHLIRLVVLKRPGFQSQKFGMPTSDKQQKKKTFQQYQRPQNYEILRSIEIVLNKQDNVVKEMAHAEGK